MKRIPMLVAVAVVLLSAASSSSLAAAPGQVSHYRLHGAVAEAGWARMIGTDFVGAYVQASSAKSGGELVVEVFHDRYDQQGRFLGSTVKHAAVTSGYAFAIDKAKLDAATVDATDVSATLMLRPNAKLTLRSDVHALWLTSRKDLWYLGGGAFQPRSFGYQGRPGGGKRGLANTWDLSADYNLSRNWSVNFYYAHAWTKGAIQSVYPNAHGADFGYMELLFRF
jgi:hypothetical protein